MTFDPSKGEGDFDVDGSEREALRIGLNIGLIFDPSEGDLGVFLNLPVCTPLFSFPLTRL